MPLGEIELLKRSTAAKGFEVFARRCVVAPTNAWINRCGRFARDYETLSRTAIAFTRLTSIGLMLRKLARYRYTS